MDRLAREIPFDPTWCGTRWTELLNRLDQLNHRALIAGPHGTGKTTFLDGLAPRLSARGFSVHRLMFTDENPDLDTTSRQQIEANGGPDDVWFIDGSERLDPAEWRWIKRRTLTTAGLVITAHRARSPRLPLLFETRSSPDMLAAFVHQLAPELAISDETIVRWYRESGGNLREALWRAYDHAAGS
ncbi:MAG: hypothetical protein KDN19_11155 [Verrucomicrobiae bacterium]|nr:hypothetical protein [Verrucomicrobiae bacterium]